MGADLATVIDPSSPGNERSIPERNVTIARTGAYFAIVGTRLPDDVVPIFDEEHRVMIGYRTYDDGITRIYDLDGRQIAMDEVPNEAPLIDPVDVILIFGSLVRVAIRGFIRAGEEVAAGIAGKAATRGISAVSLSGLRMAFRRLILRELRFSEAAAKRMADPARYVPVPILKLAIRFGKRGPDPRGTAGVFRYTIKMFVHTELTKIRKEYMLEVVVRESDWTIFHFLYDRI
jgi:hypothetical protein